MLSTCGIKDGLLTVQIPEILMGTLLNYHTVGDYPEQPD